MREQFTSMERHKMIIKEKIVDLIEGTETIIEREETNEEKTEREKLETEFAAEAAEAETKKAARQALLDKLGITEDEAKLLLS